MIRLGRDELAKYPFLPDAGKYLADQGFTLEDLGTDPDLAGFMEEAVKRIEVAADGRVYSPPDSSLDASVFSFLLAVVLLRMTHAMTLVRRFSLAEARRAERHLERDLGSMQDGERERLALGIIEELFSISVSKTEEGVAIAAPDYLARASSFHEREWKLVNRRVDSGKVLLTAHETVRLLRAGISEYISERISSAPAPPQAAGFSGAVARLEELAARFHVPTAQSGEYPPCVKHAIEVLEKGQNLPHSGRFMLATYLISRGQGADQIAPLFKNAPDYNERVTRYQLGQIIRGRDGGPYSCPSCEKIKRDDLCFATAECDGIFHPGQFGVRRA